jgi:tetratricopeptide (TPR) repeat protein
MLHLRDAAEDRMSKSPFRVFISYSHKDEKLRAGLDEHLSLLRREGAIESWTDHKIAPGREWESELDAALETADIVLLLVSASFITSDYCHDKEMRRALARHEAGEAVVIPIVIRPCDWSTALFAKLQALPKYGRPVTKWGNRDEAWEDVAKGLRSTVAAMRTRRRPTLSAPEVPAPIFSVPFQRNPYFTGREDVLAEIAARLEKGGRAALGQAAICGLGGIGKTQTAVEFAYRHRGDYRAVFFVRAETAGEILSGFAEIAALLGLAGRDADPNAAAAAARQWPATHPSWLLILDNADEPALLESWLPAAGQGHVLITSRAQDFAVLSIKGQRLAPPADPEALRFLLHRTGREAAGEAERKAAAQLAAALGNLPLALEQAAAFLVARGESFSRYLESFRQRGLHLFGVSKTPVGNHDSLTVTWSLNFEAVNSASPASADLLNALAFLAPDAIPEELFLEGGAEISPAIGEVLKAEGPLAVGTLAATLLRYSLIERDPEGQTLRVHRLVQEVVKGSLGEKAPNVRQAVVKALHRAFPWPEFEAWPRCERLLPHLLAIADGAEDSNELAWLLNSGASYLDDRARFAEAEPLYGRSLAIWEKALGADHPDVATSLNNLASLYLNQGRLAEAEPLYERSLAIQEKALGADHPDVAASLNNLASLYRNQGRLAKAEPLYERSLAIWEKSLGADHPEVAASLNNLANLYWNQGRLAEAEPLYERSLAIQEKSLGAEHPDVGTTLNNLAELYRNRGRFAEAEPLHERSLAIREKALGADHPDVAQSLNNLALLYTNQGRLAEAEPLYERSLAIQEKSLGADHPDVAQSLNNLALLYLNQGRLAEAEPLHERSLAIREKALGTDHPDVAQSLNNLAILYRKQGREAEAETLDARAQEVLARHEDRNRRP